MQTVRFVWLPPALGYDGAVPQDHEAVQLDARFRHLVEEGTDRTGREPLGFGGVAGECTGPGGLREELRHGRNDNEGTLRDHEVETSPMTGGAATSGRGLVARHSCDERSQA